MVTELSPTKVEQIVESEDVEIIDVRSQEAFEEGHLPNAENVPLEELETAVVGREWAETVVVICAVGVGSVQAARLIEHHSDADCISVAGGYESWDGATTEHRDTPA